MPVNKLVATRRGKAAVATAAAFAITSGWVAFTGQISAPGKPEIAPAAVHAAVDKGLVPPAVRLAVDFLIKDWEGLRLTAYQDSVGVWTICHGETLGVHRGMTKTAAECRALVEQRVLHDFYLPLVDRVPGFVVAPDSVQAALTSGAYNYGVGRAVKSTAAAWITAGNYRVACNAMTAFNKAGGQTVQGLVNRREMGDATRIGEGELCVSGL